MMRSLLFLLTILILTDCLKTQVKVVFFDLVESFEDIKFSGIDTQAISPGVKYRRLKEGYSLINDNPPLMMELLSSEIRSLSILMSLAHYEEKQNFIATVAQQKAEENKKHNLWLVVGGVVLAILAFVGTQVSKHFRNEKNRKNIMDMQIAVAKQAEQEAKRRARNKALKQVRQAKCEMPKNVNNDGAVEGTIGYGGLPNEIQDVLSDNNEYVCDDADTFAPYVHRAKSKGESIICMWKRLFKRRESSYDVFSSIFAPAEIKCKSYMQVQVYLHLYEETERVKALAVESDKNAERRDYLPLQCKLKRGDKVDVLLNIYGESLLVSEKKSVVWQGSFTKCSFGYFVPKDIDVDELSCIALLSVNGIPIGEMRFITRIVELPKKLNPEIIAHKYNKVFISYAHKDEAKVKSFHEGLKLAGIEHFFDRTYLKAGDVFPQVIQDYINSADLFVLFWSENASKSEYVQKERTQALGRAFPQVKPQHEAKLSIYPMSIEPRAELPTDMKDNYHFGEI